MNNMVVKEGTDILKKLTPENQTYFMTLLRLAEVAENGVRNEMLSQPRKSPMSMPQLQQCESIT